MIFKNLCLLVHWSKLDISNVDIQVIVSILDTGDNFKRNSEALIVAIVGFHL